MLWSSPLPGAVSRLEGWLTRQDIEWRSLPKCCYQRLLNVTARQLHKKYPYPWYSRELAPCTCDEGCFCKCRQCSCKDRKD